MKKFALLLVFLPALAVSLLAATPFAPFLEVYEEDPGVYATRNGLQRWLDRRQRDLDSDSKIAQTAAGPIEYKKRGSGPVVICLHGAFGGYDASYLLGEDLVAKGFTVIAVSRSGYLRTPISIGESPEEQADAMIALMDTLGIDSAATLGFSAGTLTAFQMAVRHPGRIWACVMQGVGALPQDFEPGGTYDTLRGIVADDDLVEPLDRVTWFLYDLAKDDIRLTADLLLDDDVLESMPQSEIDARIRYVKRTPQQSAFLRRFTYSMTPYSSRREGDYNDIKDDISIDPWQSWVDQGILQATEVPVQIIQAVWDGSGNHQEAKDLIAPNIPNCELVSLQGCGHFVWLGKSTYAWEKLMVAFLKNNRPAND